jgi:transcriptional regulator with XRE-family HTH domain
MSRKKGESGAKALKNWRQSNGLSQAAAGQRVGVGRVGWIGYESGDKTPPLHRALLIEAETGVRIELFGYGAEVVSLMRTALLRRAA